jgi:site-specific DNA-methyltransferase (adenine-specific)
MDGLNLLKFIGDSEIDACVVDFQYRGIMDAMGYGNEGQRQKKRALLRQMSENMIIEFLSEISRVLKQSSYLFMWVDKFILCEGSHTKWFSSTIISDDFSNPITFLDGHLQKMNLVDMLTWDKQSFGMGYRTRKTSEYLLIYQKSPKMIKSWKDKSIRDVWPEKIEHPRSGHPHRKPESLTERLLLSVTEPNDIVLDPCAGSFSTFNVCSRIGRNFLGCDISGEYIDENV